jgi:hypothetical protein
MRRALVPGDVVCIREERAGKYEMDGKAHAAYKVIDRWVGPARDVVLLLREAGIGDDLYASAGDCHLADGAVEREYRRAKQHVDAMVEAKAERDARRRIPGRKKDKRT